jgi:PPOX class probable F420-dependent enzyme
VNDAEREAFLRKPHTAVIATVDPHGRAHAVPVWYLWDGSVFSIVTGRDSAKLRHIQRTGRASLCVDQRDGRFVSVTAEGPVGVADKVTREDRLALHTHYLGPEEAQRRVASSSAHEGMVMLTLTPERWLGYGA